MVPTLTIEPPSVMWGTTARVISSAPNRMMSIDRRSCLSGVSRRSVKPGCEYAELTRPVILPNRSTAVAATRSTSSCFLTSQGTAIASPPAAATSLATWSMTSLDRAAMTTFAPSAAARAASFAPSPCPDAGDDDHFTVENHLPTLLIEREVLLQLRLGQSEVLRGVRV